VSNGLGHGGVGMRQVEGVLARRTLVVEQKTKVFELRTQYRIFDESGSQIGAVEQQRQSALTFLARLGTDWDLVLPVTLNVLESDGRLALTAHKPWFRMTVEVTRPDGTAVGSIRKRIRMGKARFVLADRSGSAVGEVRARNWRARHFEVTDQHGQAVANVTKKWGGLAREVFTDADTYAVNVHEHAIEPLRTLAISACLAIDVVMKQKDYGSPIDLLNG
jgi:uncharacterized protein YxjI